MSDHCHMNTMPTTINGPQKGGVKGGHAAVSSHFNPHVRRPAYGSHHSHRSLPGEEDWPKGLANVGNTCYANAALQCLMSTALTHALVNPEIVPLFRRYSSNPNLLAQGSGSVDSEDELDPAEKKEAEILSPRSEALRKKEMENEKMRENCEWLTRELTAITQEYLAPGEPIQESSSSSYLGWLSSAPSTPQNDNVVDPGSITRHPDRLSKCLNPYQQEDAHEFLRALLSTLVMNGYNKKLSSLFDGLLESAVTCQTCGRASLTRDRYMDLSLDINQPDIRSVSDALEEYTKEETLKEDNAVFCQKCKKKRSVTKGLRLATAPSIMVCHLKRFAFDRFGRLIRLNKKVQFPNTLEIGDFMSKLNKARPPPYGLVGVLVHQGSTCASGHYLAFVKRNNEWFKCNDSVITKVDEATVFDQQAYVLVYEVAEMREKTGCHGPRTKPAVGSEIFEDEAEISKDGRSTEACPSFQSSEHTTHYERLMSLLNNPGGLGHFFTEICCSSEISEPQTHELRLARRSSRQKNSTPRTSDTDTRGSFSKEGIKVVEVPQKNRNRNVRSQTAPRQRTEDDGYLNLTGFNMSTPSTTSSMQSNRKSRRRSLSRESRRSLRNPEARLNARSRNLSSTNLAGNRQLPPLPRLRAKSTSSSKR